MAEKWDQIDMNVLFLMLTFPDLKENTNLYTDLALEFKRNEHNVYVMTIIEQKYGKKTFLESIQGINVLRVKTGDFFNVGFVRKGITLSSLSSKLNKAYLQILGNVKFDLCIYPTPPITFNNLVYKIKKKNLCPTYLILRDIFPQNAIDVGVINKNIIYYYFRYIEKKLYKVSDYIACMTKKNIDYITEHNFIPQKKLYILPNWKKINDELLNSKSNISIRKKLNLVDKFVILFGGVIGIAQELDFILNVAKKIQDKSDIIFLIIGEGNQKEKLSQIIVREKLVNVIMFDRIPRSDFRLLTEECDLGLVCLNRNFTIPNLPSKSLDYFEAKIPVLASIDRSTDFGDFLDESGGGLWSYTGDEKNFIDNLFKLYNSPELRVDMGIKGYNYLSNNLSEKNAYKSIIRHITD
jgi:glycosyltransferase involved in cell wall biosynthesis